MLISSHMQQFDTSAQWDIRDWLGAPWAASLTSEETALADLVVMLTLLPILGSGLVSLYSFIYMIQMGEFSVKAFVWGNAGLAVFVGLCWAQNASLRSKHQPLTAFTQNRIKSVLGRLVAENESYKSIVAPICARLAQADERWGRELAERLHTIAKKRKENARYERDAQRFDRQFA